MEGQGQNVEDGKSVNHVIFQALIFQGPTQVSILYSNGDATSSSSLLISSPRFSLGALNLDGNGTGPPPRPYIKEKSTR